MGHIPRDRHEEEVQDLRRLKGGLGAAILLAVDVAGHDCRLFPELAPSIAALRDAVDDLESDIDGLIKQRDGDAEFETPRRLPAAAE